MQLSVCFLNIFSNGSVNDIARRPMRITDAIEHLTHAVDAFFGLAVQRFAAKRLPRQAFAHSKRKAGDFSTTTAAGCSIDEDEPQQLRWCRTRAVPAANSDSIILVPGAIRPSLLENRAGFYRSRNAMRVRRGAAVHFDQCNRFVEQQLDWRPVDQVRCRNSQETCLGCKHHREIWLPDIGS